MTQIFQTYSDFLNRANKRVNGVSPEFAEEHPDWEKENERNIGCWDCSDCSDCSDCYNCSYCSSCSDCSDCSGCYGCVDLNGNKEAFSIPVLENIHKQVYEAASRPAALNMDDWHTCETTHCRAGWVVHLAGQAGKELEEKTSTLFAAMQIYKASSPIRVSPVRFFETNEKAMQDMKRCAEEEANQKQI